MLALPPPLARLVRELNRLPSIGQKTAQRLAFQLVAGDRQLARDLSAALLAAREQMKVCRRCHNLADQEECAVCRNPARNNGLLCVVEEARDVFALETARVFRGRYHILGGLISPLDGVEPKHLAIASLLARVTDEKISEVIVATNPTVEGEATANYLARAIRPLGVRTTRIGFGMPVGGDLEFADELTLSRALDARREL
ncbi:MAG: recombination protein RecR [Verrucomicrobia bacterium GWF2_62_7]|nr:MAG: recombination protein RecR [Verrucomicrobia bacterium GWF2_62_7]